MRPKLQMMIAASVLTLMLCSAGGVLGASMVLNEYNAVKDASFLKNGGTDTYFGTVAGNGGDWMEFVVIQDYLDIRGWCFTTIQGDPATTDASIVVPNDVAFSGLRSGTILTISEKVATDLSYNPVYDPSNPNAGDWWINYKASFSAGDNTHKNFEVTIYGADGNPVFGPAGEPVSMHDGKGVGSDEVFKLEENPTADITPTSAYNSGTSSTFGSPNIFSGGTMTQDMSALRSCLAPEPASILALACGLGSIMIGRRRYGRK